MKKAKNGGHLLSNAAKCFLAVLADGIHDTKDPDTTKLAQALTEPELSQVLMLSAMHNVPLVTERLYRDGLGGEQRSKLRSDLMYVMAYQANALQLLFMLLGAFHEANIRALVVKGAVCRGLYPKPELRPSSDEDIYVEPKAVPAAEEILERTGFRRVDMAADPNDSVHTWGKGALRVELHSSLFDAFSVAGQTVQDYFEHAFLRSVTAQVEGRAIATLHPQDHFIYLILHYYKHFLAGGVGIRQICDICLFAQHHDGDIDWKAVWELLDALRLRKLVWNLRDLGIRYLGLDDSLMPCGGDGMCADSDDLLLDTLGAGVFGASTLERKHSSLITIRAAAGGERRSAGIAAALFPPAKSLQGKYSYLQSKPWLLPVAWCSRAFGYFREGKNVGERAAEAARIGSQRIDLMEKYGLVNEN